MITIILTCLSTNLTAGQRRALEDRVQWVFDQLTAAGKDPIVCAAFRSDTGQRVKSVPINLAAYLAVAPDIQDFTNPQVPVWVRPTTYATRHKWLGWPDHDQTPEP